MSRAFVKESESEWLGDVAPDVAALEQFLSRESGEKVYNTEVRTIDGRTVYLMSNGNCYALDFDNRWVHVSR